MSATHETAAAILVVDDNALFVDLVVALLERAYPDARIGRASCGAEGLALLGEQVWDVLLLDYGLPDLDGVEVLAEIRSRGVDVAAIMVTGAGDEELAADLFRMGVYDYLVKGNVNAATLRRSVDQVLTRRVLEEQIREKSDKLGETSRELAQRARALDTAYAKIQEKKEQLRILSEGLEQTVQQRTAELRAATHFLNKVLDSTTEHFIVATGREGTILTFNRGAEAAFGHSADSVVGSTHFRTLFREIESDNAELEALVRLCHLEGSVQRTMTGIDAEGREFIAQVTLSPLTNYDEDDRPISRSSVLDDDGPDGLVIVGSDVTHERSLEEQNRAYIRQIEVANADLRRKNEQILEATRLKSEFLANVSHELRTPLNAIIGYSDLLIGGIYGQLAEKQSAAITGVASRAQDLLRLINEILDLAKIESGRMELIPERFQLRAVAEELVETGRILAVDKQLEVGWQDEEVEELWLLTDLQKVRQILLNLVNNAVKFTPSGFVRIETRKFDGAQIEFAVHDSGIGIPEDDLESIFDEFRQVDGTSTRQYGGTGLGLAISQKFAHSLGGTLGAESELGRGSTFRLRIPIEIAVDATSPPDRTVSVVRDEGQWEEGGG